MTSCKLDILLHQVHYSIRLAHSTICEEEDIHRDRRVDLVIVAILEWVVYLSAAHISFEFPNAFDSLIKVHSIVVHNTLK